MDIIPQLHRFMPGYHCQQHSLPFMGIGSFPVQPGRSAVKLRGNKLFDGFRIGGDDLETLLGLQVVHHLVHEQRLDDQSENGEKARLHTEGKTGGYRNDDIAAQQRDTDVQCRMLFQDHCDDIRSAGGCIQIKQDGGADRRKSDREKQFHQRL